MNSRLHILKTGLATTISLWMAFLACFMGCTLPALTSARSMHASSMAEMPCHHSSGVPGTPADQKHAPASGAMSCCPLEITVAPKPDTATLAFLPTQVLLDSDSLLLPHQFHSSVELAPSIWHTGRDTLLKIRLLRI